MNAIERHHDFVLNKSINPSHPLQWRPQEQRLLFLEPGASRLVETMCLARPVRDLADSQVQWSIPQAYPRMSKFGTRSDMWLTQASNTKYF